MKKIVDYYYDFISPFAYLAVTQIPRLMKEYADVAEFRGHAFTMWEARLAAGNTGPSNREMPKRLNVLMADANRYAKRYGVPLKQTTSFDAKRINRGVYVARDLGKEMEYMTTVNNAAWGNGGDIANPAFLDECVAKIGLDPATFAAAVDSEEITARYAKENEDAQARGVFGAPTFVVDNEIFWGNDRIVWVEDYLRGRV